MQSSANETSEEPLFEKIAEEILARKRRGELPTVEEYCLKYPDVAAELRSFLPTLLAVERLKGDLAPDEEAVPSIATSADTGKVHTKKNSPPGSIGGYRILQEIGRGGMGVVYEAEQPSLDRRVALKVLIQEPSNCELRAQRFTSEARAAAGLHHSNIVPVFDVGVDGQYLYYSMQLIRGQSIAIVIEELKRLRAIRARERKVNKQHPETSRRGSKLSLSPLKSEEDFTVFDIATDTQTQIRKKVSRVAVNLIQPSVGSTHAIDGESEDDRSVYDDSEKLSDPIMRASSTGTAKLPGRFDISSTHAGNNLAYYRSVAHVGHQVANALAYVHERGILHRDIKPSNLMLDGSGTVWITDFGLAKVTEIDLTLTGDIVGTLRYMAPERFKGHCDGRGDTYSLGLTLYEMLALEPAYIAADHLNLVNKICRSSPLSLKTYDRSVPQDLETIILKSVSKEPRFRYASANEMAEDLKRFLEDQPIKARRVSPIERFWRWSRQNRILASAVSSSVLLLISVTIASVIFANIYRRLVNTANTSAQEANQAKLQANLERDFAAAESQRAQDNAQKMSDYLYGSHMQMAVQAWKSGQISRVRELLNKYIPTPNGNDQREHDWYFLDNICNAFQSVPTIDYGGIVSLLSLDPQARYFVASGDHGFFKIYDTQSHQLLQKVQAHDSKILRKLHALNGEVLITISWKDLKVWRRNEDQFELAGQFTDFKPYSACVTEDGKALLIPNDHSEVYRWNLSENEPQKILSTASPIVDLTIRNVCNQFILTLQDGTIEEYDAIGNSLRRLAILPKPLRSMETSKDGKFLVLAADDRLRKIDLEESDPVMEDVGPTPASTKEIIAMDQAFLVRCHDRVIVWDYSGVFVKELQVKPGFIVTEQMPGDRIIFTGYDNFINIYSTQNWERVYQIAGHNSTVYDCQITENSLVFSGGRDGLIRIMDANRLNQQSQTLVGHRDWLWSVRFSPDGSTVASASRDGSVMLWDVKSGLKIAQIAENRGGVHAVSFSPDGKQLVIGGWMQDVYIYDLSTLKRTIELKLHESKVNVAVFSPNGKLLLSGGDDGRVIVWDLSTRMPLVNFQIEDRNNDVWTAAFANDGEVVFGGTSNSLYRWKFALGEAPEVIFRSAENVTSSRFSHDGKLLAITLANGGITLFDYSTLEILMQPNAHASDAMHTTFSLDNRMLISAGADGNVVFWSMKTREPTVQFEAHNTHIHSIDFSPDGSRFATASWDGTVKLWPVTRDESP